MRRWYSQFITGFLAICFSMVTMASSNSVSSSNVPGQFLTGKSDTILKNIVQLILEEVAGDKGKEKQVFGFNSIEVAYSIPAFIFRELTFTRYSNFISAGIYPRYLFQKRLLI